MLCANVSEHYISSIFIGAVNKNNRDEVARAFIQEKVRLERSLGQDFIFSVILLVHTTYENVTQCSETSANKIQMPGNHPK